MRFSFYAKEIYLNHQRVFSRRLSISRFIKKNDSS